VLAICVAVSVKGVSAEMVAQATDASWQSEQGSSFISGRIEGLRSGGLLITNGAGGFSRPRANDQRFELPKVSITPLNYSKASASIVRQPLEQRCRIEHGPIGTGESLLVRCIDYESSGVDQGIEVEPSLRDCFARQLRGAAYTVGWTSQVGVQRLLQVTQDPVGVERNHHRVFSGSSLLMESIVYYPVQESQAILEMLWISPRPNGAAVRYEGISGAMPLDLAIGRPTRYRIASGETVAGELAPLRRHTDYETELIYIGPLETAIAVFPIACHLRERNLSTGVATDTWFAPGFGPIRALVRGADGTDLSVLEILEIQQHPHVTRMTDQNMN
jgi:hypothetical protein